MLCRDYLIALASSESLFFELLLACDKFDLLLFLLAITMRCRFADYWCFFLQSI